MSEPRHRPPPTVPAFAAALAAIFAYGTAGAWDIAPHRAIYTLDLHTARAGSAVSDVDGRMLFRWAESCEGWTVEQHYQLDFLYSQGQESRVRSAYSTWETKDGLEFSFNLRRDTDGVVDEELRGTATLQEQGGPGRVVYRLPEVVERPLPDGAVFPTAHSLLLLERAEAGETFYPALLFDGTDENGLSDVSAVIGNRRDPGEEGADALLLRPAWPVRLAFFSLADNKPEPDFELDIELLDNGVVRDMIIDYGDFAVHAELSELEALAEEECP